jgi:hypothetical protein
VPRTAPWKLHRLTLLSLAWRWLPRLRNGRVLSGTFYCNTNYGQLEPNRFVASVCNAAFGGQVAGLGGDFAVLLFSQAPERWGLGCNDQIELSINDLCSIANRFHFCAILTYWMIRSGKFGRGVNGRPVGEIVKRFKEEIALVDYVPAR